MLPIPTAAPESDSFLPAFMSASAKPAPRQATPRPKPAPPLIPGLPQRPRDLYLKRVTGFGFGTGQLLVRNLKFQDYAPIEILNFFLPAGLDSSSMIPKEDCLRVPFELGDQDRRFHYKLLEITRSTVVSPMGQLRLFNDKPICDWLPFTDSNFPLVVNQEQRDALEAFSGVVFKIPTGRTDGMKRVKRIPEAVLSEAEEKEKSKKRGFWKQHRVLDLSEVDANELKRELGLSVR